MVVDLLSFENDDYISDIENNMQYASDLQVSFLAIKRFRMQFPNKKERLEIVSRDIDAGKIFDVQEEENEESVHVGDQGYKELSEDSFESDLSADETRGDADMENGLRESKKKITPSREIQGSWSKNIELE